MKHILAAIMVGLAASAIARTATAGAATNRTAIAYVPTPHEVVRDMLWLANAGSNDVVYDLGSGDGRIAIAAVRDFAVQKAVGIEIDPERIRESRENARAAGVERKVEFVQGDLFETDFRQATIVTLYLGKQPNLQLRAKLLQLLAPGTRVVSHHFDMGEWQPQKVLDVRRAFLGMRGRDYDPFREIRDTPSFEQEHTVSVWVVPARVAGLWRGKITTSAGPQELLLKLDQRFSEVSGEAVISGTSPRTGYLQVDLWGEQFAFFLLGEKGGTRFSGTVRDDLLKGKLTLWENNTPHEQEWEGRRERQELAGTWRWSHPADERPIALRLEWRGSVLIGTLVDGQQETPLTDLYNFGSGVYFTHYAQSGEDRSWLIGNGVVSSNVLTGTTRFYHHQLYFPNGVLRRRPPTGSQPWTARRDP